MSWTLGWTWLLSQGLLHSPCSLSLEEQPCFFCSLTVKWGLEALHGGLKSHSFHVACSYPEAAGFLLETCPAEHLERLRTALPAEMQSDWVTWW